MKWRSISVEALTSAQAAEELNALASEMAGHDVRETQRTYARLNLRRKGTELTLPDMGRKRLESKPVDLFTDDGN